MKRTLVVASLLLIVALTVTGSAFAPQAAARNKPSCDSLAGLAIAPASIGLPTTGATVTSAALVGASPQAVNGERAVLAIPEYCKVVGSIAPVDPSAPKINFQVNLPTSWNRKLAQLGGSGNNGVIPVALTTGMQWGPESIPPNAPYALSRGFVVYGSDSGHQTSGGGRGAGADAPAGPPPPDWTANDEAFTNFAFAQMKKTHDVAVTLVAKFYGEAIRRSYYLGSSQGGREALIVVQRFPQDYDGVFAQVPAHAYVHLSIGDPLARAKSQAGDGWIPPAKVAIVGKEVLRQCDALDGIEDGLVSNYLACNRKFDPAVTPNPLSAVRCPDGTDTGTTCLSDPQILAANAVHASVSYPIPARERLDIVCRVANRKRVVRQLEDATNEADGRHELRCDCALESSATPPQISWTSISRPTRKSSSSSRRRSTRRIRISRRSNAAAAS